MYSGQQVVLYEPGSFEPDSHYYPRVLNATLHPLVSSFFNLGNERIAQRYCHLHPEVSREAVREMLSYRAPVLPWAGADLFCVTNEKGVRKVVVVELNSCPSGQKSMPLRHEQDEQGGYRVLLEKSFMPLVKKRKKFLPKGGLAVIYDKNLMEASGYAATLADVSGEQVYLVPFFDDDPQQPARFSDGVLEIKYKDQWIPIRAALRYVTQRPWNRIPPVTKTLIFNSVLGCLAGGRNKLLASKAYDLFNAQSFNEGLKIRIPETIWDVSLEETPMWVRRMGGVAVVKNPYSNAGQGVWTIINEEELEAFESLEHPYKRFIVQALIGNSRWSSRGARETLYHVGTIPDKKHRIYVADLRFMVGNGPDGFFPVGIYARRGKSPLVDDVPQGASSWDILGTNLSFHDKEGQWQSDTSRLCLADTRDFNKLGMALDDLIESYLQTIMATISVNRMGASLVSTKGLFKRRFFKSVNPDSSLVAEVCS